MSESTLKTNLPLKTGSSGRAVAQRIDNDLLVNLYHHITMERDANVQYFAMSLWLQERELKGFSSYFLNESKEEMDHAYKFTNYLIARGQFVKLNELKAPIQEWNSIEELISYAFIMESDLTTSIQQIYSIADRSLDIRTNVFLDPIIEKQISSEDELAHILGKIKFASNQPSALLIIDKDLSLK